MFIIASNLSAASAMRSYEYEMGNRVISYSVPEGLAGLPFFTHVGTRYVSKDDQRVYWTSYSERRFFREVPMWNFAISIVTPPANAHSWEDKRAWIESYTRSTDQLIWSAQIIGENQWRISKTSNTTTKATIGIGCYLEVSDDTLLAVSFSLAPGTKLSEPKLAKIRNDLQQVLSSVVIKSRT